MPGVPAEQTAPSIAPPLSILESGGLVIYRYSLTPALRIDYVSANAAGLTGVEADRIRRDPESLFETIHPHDRAMLRRITEGSAPEPTATVRWCHADGRIVWAQHHRVIQHDAGRNVTTVVGFAVDITPHSERPDDPAPFWLGADTLRALSERVEQMRERDRTRIARELHDELGQLLTGAKLSFGAALRELRGVEASGRIIDHVQVAMGHIDLVLAAVRRIASSLRPSALDHRDLVGALEDEARRVSALSGIRIRLANRLHAPVDPATATVAFRVFQEALTNAVRHSRASAISTLITERPDGRLMLCVRDNGVGIPDERLHARESLGLLGMQERARGVGGHVRLDSRPGRGTRVLLTLPTDRR
ncbi:MAG: ATP-binding protein [Vicinamibacterales bacterium]